MKRGDVFFAYLEPVVGSEQGGMRPVLVVQNDTGNKHSLTTIVAPMTTKAKSNLPTHVKITIKGVENIILLEQIRAISFARLISYHGALSAEDMEKVDKAMAISIGLTKQEGEEH